MLKVTANSFQTYCGILIWNTIRTGLFIVK